MSGFPAGRTEDVKAKKCGIKKVMSQRVSRETSSNFDRVIVSYLTLRIYIFGDIKTFKIVLQ